MKILIKKIIFFTIVVLLGSCGSDRSSSSSTDTFSSNSKDGVYAYNGNGAELSISVSGSSWSGSVKLCDFCDLEYQSGTVEGEGLYDGGSKIGYFSGNNLITTIGGNSITLSK